MSEAQTETKKAEKKVSKKQVFLKKLDPDAAKTLQILKDKANKKSFGRKVRDSELLSLGLKLIEAGHIVSLQEQTLSEKDRLHMDHEEYQKQYGKLSLDQFIGMLRRGEVQSKKVIEPKDQDNG